MRLVRRVAAGAAGACLIVVGAASAASAHVTVNPGEATVGGFAKLDFRVPNEEVTAATNKIEVQFPTDVPIVSVGVMPHQGWTYSIEKTKLAAPVKDDDGNEITDVVSKISWSGGTIKPGEFDEFSVSVGPLPDKPTSLTFKTVQTYDNGDVVRWIDEAAKGQPEPAHPAPVLTVLAEAGASSSSDGTARALGIIGIVVGVAGAALGGFGLRRRQPAA
jgi:periplasmic copper chaperone A